ncbi:nucleoside hydrolase [Motilibacter aurantiacus]|uniref:nucleoside hydrolase n=1 Tax=Motilibacter aurantiacus TaxID=2714955 RepID=UPI001E353D16|nr:nucleoside hydrolase [Motilibacter aurantiacus]
MIVDTDGGSDDAVALLLALAGGAVEAVTTVAGNVPVGQATVNVLRTLDALGSSVPVYAGATAPLTRPWERGSCTHGSDGLGDAGLPPPVRAPTPGSAVGALLASAAGGTLLTLGPLTNVALALGRDPRLLEKFHAVVCMLGRSDGAEFNAYADPEAAAAVLAASGPPRVLLGKDVSERDGLLSWADRERLAALQTAEADVVLRVTARAAQQAHREGRDGHDLPDALATAVALDPTLLLAHEAQRVGVGTTERDRGRLAPAEGPVPARVVTAADGPGFRRRLLAACGAGRSA